MRKIYLGTRGSRLALAQVAEVVRWLGLEDCEIKVFETSGDRDKSTPIDPVNGTDFFTDRLETALRDKEIDLSVHSAKDLPEVIPDGLEIASVTKSIDPADVLVSKNNLKLNELPVGSRVGTSSKRRKEQLQALRPDLEVADLRGTVNERLEKLDRGEYEALIVAAAALIRLGMSERIAERFSYKTAPGQGALALEIRTDDEELKLWLKRQLACR